MEGQYASISSLAVTHFPSLNHVLQWGDLSVHVLTFKLYAEKKRILLSCQCFLVVAKEISVAYSET